MSRNDIFDILINMAIDAKDEIEKKKNKILNIEKDMTLIYEELGRSIASFVEDKDFFWCDTLLTSYVLSESEYLKLKNKQEQLSNLVNVLNSCVKKSKLLRIELIQLRITKKELLLRYGATAFEAYELDSLETSEKELVEPLFLIPHNTITDLQLKLSKSKNYFYKKIINTKILNNRKKLKELFYKASLILEEKNCLDKIPSINKEKMSKNYYEIKVKENDYISEIEKFDKLIAEIKKDKKEGPESKLLELKKTVELAKANSQNAAILLGKELYSKLPDKISSKEIGVEAIDLIDQITLHKRSLKKVEKDIKLLENEVKVDEIYAQIDFEYRNIKHLEKQISSCKDKIKNIELTIENKKSQIDLLKDEGVYNNRE